MGRLTFFALLLITLIITITAHANAAVSACPASRCLYLPLLAAGGVPAALAPSPSTTPIPSATTPAATPTATFESLILNPTETSTSTSTPTNTPTATSTSTSTPTNTPTATSTSTSTPTNTPTATSTSTSTPTNTPTATSTPTSTPVPRVTAQNSGNTAVYDTFELVLNAPLVSDNKFSQFASLVVTDTQSTRVFTVEGFYDGGSTWRARFMPDAQGLWSYRWSFDGVSGTGSFTATPKTNSVAHGHVKVSASDKRDLVYDDGTAHYWYGSKWIHATNYGPPSKNGELNVHTSPNEPWNDYVSDEQILAFLDDAKAHGLNGVLLKIGLFPLEDDKISWDLPWIQRGEWVVREAAKRGLYVQINIFNEWSRKKNTWFVDTDDGSQQIMSVWKSDSDDAAKRNYVRTVIARFSGYYNVYWELGNEMARRNDGNSFKTLATNNYIPWIHQYDPYRLPIGLSETNIADGFKDVDIVFAHRGFQFKPQNSSQAWIANELYASWTSGEKLSHNYTLRNPDSRLGYRRSFWRQFAYGSNGTSTSSWWLITTWITDTQQSKQTVYTVLDDQHRLRDFIEALPVSVNDLDPMPAGSFVTSVVSDSSRPIDEVRTRALAGQVYVSYFLVELDAQVGPPPASAGQATIALPPDGTYKIQWYDPKTGQYSDGGSVAGGSQTIARPAISEDIVLLVTRQS